ncbi:hypothetical protein D3C78_674310 [compost metagenome]
MSAIDDLGIGNANLRVHVGPGEVVHRAFVAFTREQEGWLTGRVAVTGLAPRIQLQAIEAGQIGTEANRAFGVTRAGIEEEALAPFGHAGSAGRVPGAKVIVIVEVAQAQ